MLPLLLLLSTVSSPAATPTPGEQLQALDGPWRGELIYLDYQSHERVTLPARVELELVAENTLLRRLEYSDPGWTVRAVDLTVFSAGGLQSVSEDDGKLVMSRWTLTSADIQSSERWRSVHESEGTDGGRPAALRMTHVFENGVLSTTQEVRLVGVDGSSWFVRNELVLRRQTPTQADLTGTWQVDLRSNPGDPVANTVLEFALAADDKLTGTFYGSPLHQLRLILSRGTLHFAFVTEDGSGPYHTTGRLLADGTLVGTTHSLGRDFLSSWTAVH